MDTNRQKEKEDAEVLRLGLITGCVNLSDVTKWADEIIAKCDDSPMEIIDVAMSKEANDLITKLQKIRGIYDWNRVLRRFFRLLYDSLLEHPEGARTMAHQLYVLMMHCEIELPSDLQTQIHYFDDGFELAVRGIYGDVVDLTRQLNDFLLRNSSFHNEG